MTAIGYALLAYFGWGLGDTVTAVLVRKVEVGTVAFWGFLFRLLIYTALIPVFGQTLSLGTWPLVALQLLIGLVTAIGYVAFFKASQLINPMLVAAIAGSWGGISLLISLVFLGETLTLTQAVGVGVIITGLLMTLFAQQGLHAAYRKLQMKGLALSLVPMLGWAMCGSLTKLTIDGIGWFWSTYLLTIPFVVVAVSMKHWGLQVQVRIGAKRLGQLLGYALLIAVGEVSFFLGIQHGLTAIVSPVAGSYVTLVVVLSYFLFADPMSMWQKWGVGLTCVGIVGLAVLG